MCGGLAPRIFGSEPVDIRVYMTPAQLFSLEDEAAEEALIFQKEGEPILIILPHAVIGDFLEWRPDGNGFIRLGGGAGKCISPIDVAVDIRAVRHGKLKFS